MKIKKNRNTEEAICKVCFQKFERRTKKANGRKMASGVRRLWNYICR